MRPRKNICYYLDPRYMKNFCLCKDHRSCNDSGQPRTTALSHKPFGSCLLNSTANPAISTQIKAFKNFNWKYPKYSLTYLAHLPKPANYLGYFGKKVLITCPLSMILAIGGAPSLKVQFFLCHLHKNLSKSFNTAFVLVAIQI